MKKRVLLDKRIGETPLEAVARFKAAYPRYAAVPASYAGRLDPMASGTLLVLLGDECKRQSDYTRLDKTYNIEVLLDIGSDTGDVLGMVETADCITEVEPHKLREALAAEQGAHARPYPLFSSKTIAGKPLFLYALEGTVDTISIPTHVETIHRISLKGSTRLSSEELQERIASLLALAPKSNEPSKLLGADFRIHAVRNSWQPVFLEPRTYAVLKLRVSCGSGTYMRSLAGRIGEALGTRALALSIRRIRIGRGLRCFPFPWRVL